MRLLLLMVGLAVCPYFISSQPSGKKTFAKAESCHLFGEFEMAVPLYMSLEKPDNYNIKYKLGTCFLNIEGEKDKSIPYLETAAKNSSYDAKVNSFKEKRAPLDSWFFLARSYMINNQLELAISTFETFRKLVLETEERGGMKNPAYIDKQIEACRNAMAGRESPYRVTKKLVSEDFSRGYVNENPAVSFDGNTLVYTERRGLENTIFFSRKINGRWQPPGEINSQLQSGNDCSSCSLNRDGTLLLLYKTDNYDGNIYSSEFVNNEWTPVRKLNNNINTRFYESHAAISADNTRLYFTSNREGGYGGLDIYFSERNGEGDWGPAVNLGSVINTEYNEDTPFLTLNDSILYFSSEGHSGVGGYDIYRIRGSGLTWEPPENLGFPVNSTDDDRFFQPFNNDRNGYYALVTGIRKKEIFYVSLTRDRLTRVFDIKGNFSLKDSSLKFDDSNLILLIDRIKGDTIDVSYPESLTGNFNFTAGPGNYRLIFSGQDYYPQSIDTILLVSAPSDIIKLNDVILDKLPDAKASVSYEKIDLTGIPSVTSIDSAILVRNLQVLDVTENDAADTSILFFTVQVMALYNPVDVSYFKYMDDIKVLYNGSDYFYRYTTGQFHNKEDAYLHKNDLLQKGYPEDIFVKKVRRMPVFAVQEQKYFTIQMSVSKTPVNAEKIFKGFKGVTESKGLDGTYHYHYGIFTSPGEAESALRRAKQAGFPDAFVTEISLPGNK